MQVTVPIPELRELIVARLSQHFDHADADRMADAVLFGEVAGRATHGIARLLPGSFGAMDEPPGSPPVTTRTSPSAAHIEGSPGMLVAHLATDLTIEIAQETGMAVVTTAGSRSTSGSLTFYVERMTQAGLVAMVSANTLALVAPPGGTKRTLGTNPFAIGIPTLGYPFVFDIGTAAISFGELAVARAAGLPIPEGVAVDETGEVSTDPAAIMHGGALLAFGGHKGLGLAMAVELLNGVLAGADAVGVGPEDSWGHTFIGISLDSLGDANELRARAQEMVDRIATTPTKSGSEVRIPGSRSLAARDAALERGTIEVEEATLEQLRALVSG